MAEEMIFSTRQLGPCKHRSPLELSTVCGDGIGNFTPADALVRYQIDKNNHCDDSGPEEFFEKAGAREYIHFKPAQVRAAIVTCGGLCPGLNNVIRSIYRQLSTYGVRRVLGIQGGFKGLNPDSGLEPIDLTADYVEDIHKEGGTVLSTSRGQQDTAVMADFLQSEGIRILFCIGGDGTQRGAHALAEELKQRKADISIVGIPKTIDNDIFYVSRTFGYNTAIGEARKVLDCAHVEAKGVENGVGLVHVMGRDSGFIAVGATLASQEANFCLIPEVPFRLEGPGGFLELLEARLKRKKHAVVVVAEGAGQDLMRADDIRKDASGNVLHRNIGIYLKEQINRHFAERPTEVHVKYFDPSYMIRSVPANADDSLFCDRLARHAVHAAMAGRTDLVIGRLHGNFIHVPSEMIAQGRKKVDPEGDLWISVHETTGQPLRFINGDH